MDLNYILLSRNRVRKQEKIYLYEAVKVFLHADSKKIKMSCGGRVSVSDMAHLILCRYYLRRGKVMDFLKEKELLKINYLDKAIA